MNQVQVKAKKFADRLVFWQPVTDELISLINKEISNFRKQADKVEFLEVVISDIRAMYAHHLKTCTHKDDPMSCIDNQRYEEQLFHLQDALDDLPELQTATTLKTREKEVIEAMLSQILTEVTIVREAQQISSVALAGEIDLIKNFLWQNRGSFEKELLAKFFDYTAGAAVSVAAAPEIQQLGSLVRKMIMKD